MTTGLKEAILEFFPGNPRAVSPKLSDLTTVSKKKSWEESLGRAPTRAGAAGRQECGALGVGRASTHWASPYWASHQRGGASHQTRLGQTSWGGRWASQYSLGKPVLMGEPVLIGRTTPLSQWPTPGAVPARHCACSARLVKCLLGTASACSARSVPTSARSARLLTSARSARLIKCPLGTVPARHV